jgi:O-antigen ligase
MGANIRRIRFDRILFYLTIILLPTQLGYHFWPEWSLILGRRVDYLSPTIFLTDILIGLTLIFWFIDLAFTKQKIFLKTNKLKYINFILFLTLVTINIIASGNHIVSIMIWLRVFEYLSFGLYIILNIPKLINIYKLLAGSIIWSSLLALSEFIFQRSIGGIFWWLGERTFTVDTPGIARAEVCGLFNYSCKLILRPYASFPHPNVLGGYISVLFPILIYLFIKYGYTSQKIINKIILFILLILIPFITLLVTFSRGAEIAFFCEIVIAFVWWIIRRLRNKELSYKREVRIYSSNEDNLNRSEKFSLRSNNNKLRRLLNKIILPLLILSSVTGIIIFVILTVIHGNSVSDESIVVREQLNSVAIYMIKEKPIFGVGLGNFLLNLPRQVVTREIYFLQPVHNIYLLLISEIGIFGIIIIASFILSIKYSIRNNYKFKLLNILPIIGILIIGLFDHYPLTLLQGRLLTTLALAFLFI